MTKKILIGIKNRKLGMTNQSVECPIYCLKKSEKSKRCRGERGKQKIPPSGHLAATVQMKKGRFYPRIPNLDEQERIARLRNKPEEVPQWFTWLYQWKEKDEDDLWKTRSKRVSSSLVHSIKYMISAEKPVPEILNFISLHS